ncbi:hypothetical protein EIP91_003167 [Steccherinum ochraceum]|uniref:O-acyltransferase n=1 Tax=Steccherinum ochraceum TaxID=92696 RepID=A0A4R0S4A3_9APHY|nr:hypothetical protein EIP91_003167 [Steccherinum ochraceum]
MTHDRRARHPSDDAGRLKTRQTLERVASPALSPSPPPHRLPPSSSPSSTSSTPSLSAAAASDLQQPWGQCKPATRHASLMNLPHPIRRQNSAPHLANGDAHIPPHAVRQSSGAIETDKGTIYVSKPFRSGTSKKLKAMITFTPRKSHFDIENDSSRRNEFRGFFTLFWMSLFLSALSTYVRSIDATGMPLPFDFFNLFSRDALNLALSDFAVVLSTFIAMPFIQAVSKGYIRYYWIGVAMQHVAQMTLLLGVIKWTFQRNWPWVQSGYLTLHTLVMIMKVHSYVSTNGYLAHVNAQAQATIKRLHALAEKSDGSYEAAITTAQAHRKKLDEEAAATAASSSTEVSQNGTPMVPEGVTATYIDAAAAVEIRQQMHLPTPSSPMKNSATSNSPRAPPPPSLKMLSPDLSSNHATPSDNALADAGKLQTTGTSVLDPQSVRKPNSPHPLCDHPDEKIAGLAKEYTEMEGELVSTGPAYVRWPENVTYKNYAVYLLIPTLVYELEYPRTDRIRPLYVFEKTVATFGTFALLYTVTESFIIPLTPNPEQSFWRSLLDLSIPFMVAYLLLFYIIFECICNGFAELSYFADRQFYDDWWNSTSWDEFSRKWNKPVHTFLLRHVYASTMSSYKISRQSAMFLTFLLSAAVHELVMAIVTKKIRMYLFTLQLIQIPLIAVGRLPIIKRNKLMGNIVFWCGLYAGFPLLCVAYCAY